jgi:hypothetical protein
MQVQKIVLFAVLGAAQASATLIFDQIQYADFTVAVPPGARGVVRFFPGGGMGTEVGNLWAPTSINLGNLGAGALSISVQDLGPASCTNGVCVLISAAIPGNPGNMFLQGNIYEPILDGQSLGYTSPLDINGLPTLPVQFVPVLPAMTFNVGIAAGAHQLNFDDLTIAYVNPNPGPGNPVVKWPGGSIFQDANQIQNAPDYFLTDAFEVTGAFTPEPQTWLLLASGFGGLVLARRSRAARFFPISVRSPD